MKSFRIAAVMLFVFAGAASGIQTFIDVHDFGHEGVMWDFESEKLPARRSVNWMHALSGYDSSCTVTETTLKIEGSGIETGRLDLDGDGHYEQQDNVAIAFKGHPLGPVTGNSRLFNLLSQQPLPEASNHSPAELIFRNDWGAFNGRRGSGSVGFDWSNSAFLKHSKLIAGCEPVEPFEPVVPPSTVPAPSAIVLAGIGTLVVGFLRNRGLAT